MKKGLFIALGLIFVIYGFSYAADANCDYGWKSGCQTEPHTHNPKWLVDQGDWLGDTEREKTFDLESGWGLSHTLWYEDGGGYNWIMCVFESNAVNTWDSATARFKAKVESGDAVSLYGYDRAGWHLLRTNDGGSNPAIETNINVTDYIAHDTGENCDRVILLMEGSNAGYNEMWCDVCDLNAN